MASINARAPLKRQGSSLKRQPSLGQRNGATTGEQPQTPKEVPWDMLDRCLLPIIFCHATSVVLGTILNVLRISQVSSLTLFIWLTIITMSAVLFYHNLTVRAAGKAVLITGCDNRVGATIARQLDGYGFTVFAGFDSKAGNPVAEQLKEEGSGRLHCLQLDVSSETQILASSLYICENLPENSNGLWAIINAAHYVALGELEWIPYSVLRKSIDTNVLGTARLIQIMLPLVRRAKGRIINVTSGLARIAAPVRGIYCSSLTGLETLSTCLREELRPRGVDVVIVAPGEYTTGSGWLDDESLREQAKDMWSHLSREQQEEYGEEYFERAIRSLEKFTRQDADLTPVLKALTDAVTRTFPLPRYTPVTRSEKIQALIAEHLPRSVYDIIYSRRF
ncbi:D-beta-hydroxybutyrate dehydrogenase, mitochondrial isoform X2 [Chrysoperla carnea]|uniref:D-beta-hydroxybutyrate dehydrogenase, mitochondrial isoform X2 n=1 Tax=Chrysoperla carnea TaxID=189513 RepID=UPI001D097B64|nr:D-beta-hydroxybutyrate dehydrogenase, mitochondrial isoform X2 [Chrysoperla carnea]